MFSGVLVAQSLVFSVVLCRLLLVFVSCFFKFSLVLALSVLRFTASDYPLLFFCIYKNEKLSFLDICREILEPFDFELVIEENLTGDQLLKSVEKHSVNLERQDIDCFICIVTGYMHNGHMYGIDGVPVMLHKMFEPLRITDKRDHEQPSVGEDKVKIIFVDAFKVREKIVEELDGKLTRYGASVSFPLMLDNLIQNTFSFTTVRENRRAIKSGQSRDRG